MSDLHQLDVLINDAGVKLSEVNSGAEEQIAAGVVTAVELGPMLGPLSKMSKLLAAIQGWSTDAQKAPSVPPVVISIGGTDVMLSGGGSGGGGDIWSMYTGPRDASSLSLDDMRFVITTSSGGTFAHNAWYTLIGGDVRGKWQEAAQGDGLNHFNQAGYIAANGELVQAYRAAGGPV